MTEVTTQDRPIGVAGSPVFEDHRLAIAVLERGFVFVGQVTTDDRWVRVAGARSLIRWGTTKHLAQLANEGPQTNTKLGASADVKAPLSSLIAILPVDASKWNA